MALMSGNLVSGGDFESTSYLVNEATPDGILPHRFSQTYDVGKWIGHWGPPSNPGGIGGFSTYDNPRNLVETGGDGTMGLSNLGNLNRSVDPLNPGNHIMEAVMFRPSMTQWIKAPDNQVPGPMSFSFDLLMENGLPDYDSWGTVAVYGMKYLPPDNVTFFREAQPGAPGAVSSVYDPDLNPDDGELLFSYTYGEWLQGSTNGIDPPYQFFGQWQHYDTTQYLENLSGSPIESDGTPDYKWFGTNRVVKTELTQTYPYYVVGIYPIIYDESHTYFWLYGARITDDFAMGYDNFTLQVTVVPEPAALSLLALGGLALLRRRR
ncbi:MAG: PEP-CTERM sorting domain-containing protein [Phycisphaeraceae bacterium]|nr:PEP-CTERM sorting domain-containing protein [Phycisphaeraceae bacterium]